MTRADRGREDELRGTGEPRDVAISFLASLFLLLVFLLVALIT
jgi:hypothetical protein